MATANPDVNKSALIREVLANMSEPFDYKQVVKRANHLLSERVPLEKRKGVKIGLQNIYNTISLFRQSQPKPKAADQKAPEELAMEKLAKLPEKLLVKTPEQQTYTVQELMAARNLLTNCDNDHVRAAELIGLLTLLLKAELTV